MYKKKKSENIFRFSDNCSQKYCYKLSLLGLFVNPLTADEKYSLLNRGNLLQHFQMHLSQKQKIFSKFFLHFVNLNSISNIFKKNEPRTWKYVVR